MFFNLVGTNPAFAIFSTVQYPENIIGNTTWDDANSVAWLGNNGGFGLVTNGNIFLETRCNYSGPNDCSGFMVDVTLDFYLTQ